MRIWKGTWSWVRESVSPVTAVRETKGLVCKKIHQLANTSLEKCFPDFNVHSNHPGFVENADSALVGVDCGLRPCLSSKAPGVAKHHWTWVQQDPRAVILTQRNPNRLELSQHFRTANVSQLWFWIMLILLNPKSCIQIPVKPAFLLFEWPSWQCRGNYYMWRSISSKCCVLFLGVINVFGCFVYTMKKYFEMKILGLLVPKPSVTGIRYK